MDNKTYVGEVDSPQQVSQLSRGHPVGQAMKEGVNYIRRSI